MVQAAVRGRLAGLASWHPDGTISAHPLVRDTFRPLVLAAAGTAADTALAGMPAGTVTSRADALRVVEAIELLLDAGQWQPADDMYRGRSGNGDVWKHLPAARLGQRAATAFVATPARRDACATHLDPRRLGFYLNEVGLFAMTAGDLATAREYLSLAVRHDRDAEETLNLALALQNLAECLGHLGQTGPARTPRPKRSPAPRPSATGRRSATAHAYLGWLAGLVGDTARPSSSSPPPTRSRSPTTRTVDHLYSLRGTWWAEWLARTGRPARPGR